VHEIDAIEVLRLAATTDRPGTFNVAGNGVLLLSQAIRRAGKLAVAVPVPAVAAVGRAMRRSGLLDFSPEQTQFLNFGRVVSNQRLKDEFGYLPSYSTEEAFDSLLPELRSLISPELVAAAERRLARLLRLPVARPAVPADPLRAARSGNARSGKAGSGTVRHG
jgi:UDP-glucose 4-epimerase